MGMGKQPVCRRCPLMTMSSQKDGMFLRARLRAETWYIVLVGRRQQVFTPAAVRSRLPPGREGLSTVQTLQTRRTRRTRRSEVVCGRCNSVSHKFSTTKETSPSLKLDTSQASCANGQEVPSIHVQAWSCSDRWSPNGVQKNMAACPRPERVCRCKWTLISV